MAKKSVEGEVLNVPDSGLLKIPKYAYKGIKRIEIPKEDSDFATPDFGKSILLKYLPSILAEHAKNAIKIDFFYNYFLGRQDILNKERLYEKDSKNNHKVVENHAFRQVNFKVGFLTSEKRDYTQKTAKASEIDENDLVYLDRYYTDCSFYSKDKDLKEWVYATGIGTTFTRPRTDIIVDTGEKTATGERITRYRTKEEGFDINYEAPFRYNTVDPRANFVVYSSMFDKTPLFCVSIVDVDVSKENKTPEIRQEIHIETRYAYFVVQSSDAYTKFYNFTDEKFIPQGLKVLRYLPIIEYSTNEARMGIVELNRDSFNAINTVKSSVADMIVDNANVILVFKNVDIDGKQVEEMKEAGAIIIGDSQTANNNINADLKTITVEIPFEGLNTYYEQTLQQSYDIAGVPLASGKVTSGGDTGQARLLGGGWNNAYIMINNDITTLLRYDYEQLKLILQLCKDVPNCPLDKLNASEIDIKYRINQNDNFLVKTQGIQNLYNVNMPLDEIVKVSGLFSDVPTTSSKWAENIKRLEEENAKKQGNNSQE